MQMHIAAHISANKTSNNSDDIKNKTKSTLYFFASVKIKASKGLEFRKVVTSCKLLVF